MDELQPRRTIDELKELARLTSDENGGQRVAFSEKWAAARKWLEERRVESERDEAGTPLLISNCTSSRVRFCSISACR
jgi:hypothetical protein